MTNKSNYFVLGIFLITLVVRLYLAFTIPNFTYESYFNLRQVEHIKETGLPLYEDPLSYGGRVFQFLPLFHYVAAFLNLFYPLDLIAKILPNLFLSSLTLIIYFISKKITNNETASLLSAFLAGFLPITFATNAFVVESLFLPLTFLATYAFLNLDKPKYLHLFILCLLLLTFTSSAAFLIVIGLVIYLLLTILERKKIIPIEIELTLFSVFFFIWTQFIFFKDVLIKEGTNFIWQNIPAAILNQYFPAISVLDAIILVNAVPFLAGIFVVYRSLFHYSAPKNLLLISFAVSTALLSLLRLIQFQMALAFFGLVLAILFATFYDEMEKYLAQTKFYHSLKYFPFLILLLLIASLIPPAINTAFSQEVPSNDAIEAYKWLEKKTPDSATVVSSLKEAHLITYYGKRKNLIDDNFGLINDVESRFSDVDSLFTTSFQTQAFSITDEFNIQYIVLSRYARQKYQIKNLPYYTPDCLQRNYLNETIIYKVRCTLEPTK